MAQGGRREEGGWRATMAMERDNAMVKDKGQGCIFECKGSGQKNFHQQKQFTQGCTLFHKIVHIRNMSIE